MITAREFATLVATRVEQDVSDVLPILRQRGVLPTSAAPRPRKLLLRRIAFSGVKTSGTDERPFGFEWSGLKSGLVGIASHENLRGKSSILEIVLWCLRGRQKGLQEAVRSWLGSVALDFDIDGAPYRVGFDLEEGQPVGALTRGSETDRTEIHVASFSGDDEFEGVMGDLMVRVFELVDLKVRQKLPRDTLAQTVTSGWVAYSNALHIAGTAPVLLGDEVFGGLAGRLLQMFLGVPYAELTMAAAAAAGEEQQAEQQSKRRADLDRRADQDDAGDIEKELISAREALAKAMTAGGVVEESAAQADIVAKLIGQRTELAQTTADLQLAAERARRAADEDQATVLHLDHSLKARRFFTGLLPVCCPRCQRPIGEDRRSLETQEGNCSVCATPREPDTQEAAEAELETAKERTAETKATADAIVKQLQQCRQELTVVERDLTQEQAKLRSIEQRRLTGDARLRAELDVARLEGRLQERRERAVSRQEEHKGERAILVAAHRQAEGLRKVGSEDLVKELNSEISDIARRLGIRELEGVEVGLGATMKVQIGGKASTFSKLTDGERLRLRIATVIAMLRIGERRRIGRHPGLLLIDSPADAEVVDESLTELFRELDALTQELSHLQIFVATAKPQQLSDAIPVERRRIAGPGEYLW